MFVILTYDVRIKRNARILKICRKYLVHVQRSVFEGVITEAKLNRLKKELAKEITASEDMIIIYKLESLRYTAKETIGVISAQDNIL